MILLLAAVPTETDRIRQAITHYEEIQRPAFTLRAGRIGDQHLGLLHTGVGKVNTAITLTSFLERADVSAVVQFGVGGAYPNTGLKVGDLALASAEIYGDEGSLSPEGFLDLQALSLPSTLIDGRPFFNRFPLRDQLVSTAQRLLGDWADTWGIHLKAGPFVTVSCCSGLTDRAVDLSERTGGICESMEGAAAAQICAQHSIPFLEIRGISNLTLDRDFDSWDIPTAAAHAQAALLHLLEYWTELE